MATSRSAGTPPASGELPVDAVLADLRAALDGTGVAVLQAPPGAGKTTRVPLDLLQHRIDGRLVLLEPRRVAARAAAQRLASQLGETVGMRVGLTTRDEQRTSGATRIEVVTEGVLLRRLQRDPTLPGTGTVFFDEFHERNLEGDLALAFVLETRAALRPDLRVVVASATLDGGRVTRLVGGAPVITASGRLHPVDVEHRDRPPPDGLIDAVAQAVTDLVADGSGDVLVFLPGIREIRQVIDRLEARPPPGDPRVLALHGALPSDEQDAALTPTPAGRCKVVVSTDLAESSLTIEGVTSVVDAGLSREPRFDPAREMTGLVTVPASRASADQRAGRAGRTAPGRCIRLWPAREHLARDAHPRPDIMTDDLTGAALEVAAWGADVAALALLDQPPTAAWERARTTLAELGALDGEGRITGHGRQLADLPVHPRLGHLLLRGRDLGLGGVAAEVAAVLADRDPFVVTREAPCADITARVRVLRGARAPAGVVVRRGALARARKEARRLERILGLQRGNDGNAGGDVDRAGELVALGWPDRVAGLRAGQRGSFLLAGGRGAQLPDGDLLAGEAWLAVAHLDRGATAARIHLAAPLDVDRMREVLGDAVRSVDEVAWRNGDVVAEKREEFGALVLGSEPLASPDREAVLAALLDGLRQHGVGLLRWEERDRQFQARVALLRRVLGEAWPDLSDDALLADVDETIAPFLWRAKRRADLAAVRAADVLSSRLTSRQLTELDTLAPSHLEVPSGSRLSVDYTAGDQPVLAVRLQEVLGAVTTPTIVGGRLAVVLHLLSPARRPVQVTDDLAGFWERVYPQVRAELRGRYPKHAWPEDPRTAQPLRGTKRRR